jgi:hypothetical protein
VLVVDADDRPVVGARVHVLITSPGGASSVRTHAPDGVTDGDGAATVWLRDPGTATLALYVEREGLRATRAPVAAVEPTRVVLRVAAPLTVELRDVPPLATPELRIGGTRNGLILHALAPSGANEIVVPDPRTESGARLDVRGEWSDGAGVFSAAGAITGDATRCTLTFTRTSAPIPVRWSAAVDGDLTLGVFVRKFGQGPFTFRHVATVPGGTAATSVTPRVVGEVTAAAWSPRIGLLRARAPCRHDDPAGLLLEPAAEETVDCRVRVLGDDGRELRGRLELRAALPPHWTCGTGHPASMRVHADALGSTAAMVGALPRTFVEGVFVGEDGRPQRVPRTTTAAEMLLRVVPW